VILSISTGLASLVFFLMVESRTDDPMLPLSLFRSRSFSGANLLTLLLYAALSGALFFLPLNLIQVQGYSATAAGAALLPFILIMFFLSHWSGGLVARYGARGPLVTGPIIAGAGFCLFAVPSVGANYWTSFFPAVVVLGVGMAISVAPLTTTVMNSVNQNQAGVASGVNNAVSRTAGVLALAVFPLIMLYSFNRSLDHEMVGLEVDIEARQAVDRQRTSLAAIELPTGLSADHAAALRRAIAGSFVKGFRIIMLVAAGLSVASALSAWLMLGRRAMSSIQVRLESRAG
jgi:hypothetical protein